MLQFQFATKKRIQKKPKKEDDANPIYTLTQALKLVRSHAIAPYVESIDFCVILNVDPKHGDQIVRGTAQMPFGLGKQKKVCVFASEYSKQKVLDSGADMFGDDEVIKNIKNGVINFEQIISTPEGLIKLKPYARILGPKGLMPNVKIGNLVEEEKLEETIKNAKIGQVQFRVDPGSNIHSPLGKITLSDKQIVGNLQSLLNTLIQKKPDSVKQNYFVDAYLKPTKGPSFRVNIETIDPRNKSSQLLLFQ
ncbi:ribosomal protein, putative [Ichthyophthirius multifiliis]|uniref:Ribosomal protein, putative n=1 Tax=Ichthyophthirius multifiliis TaxID=5932 RepID=G0QVE9_ICHMU|nr:ribosomal protein, putative [Ichthyophthirius multifiliis]EGR30806.1 ribosomal protein, putative [Ichthyophthirius multifiliis]|eukprot:XP_004032393.1 ribosomal protein, putative [Ichthyophthirius multifiliis]